MLLMCLAGLGSSILLVVAEEGVLLVWVEPRVAETNFFESGLSHRPLNTLLVRAICIGDFDRLSAANVIVGASKDGPFHRVNLVTNPAEVQAHVTGFFLVLIQ